MTKIINGKMDILYFPDGTKTRLFSEKYVKDLIRKHNDECADLRIQIQKLKNDIEVYKKRIVIADAHTQELIARIPHYYS